MTYMHVISQFFAHHFPRWGVCHLNYDCRQRILYFHCRAAGRRAAIFQDAKLISKLDIGIERFVVIHPDYPDIIIRPEFTSGFVDNMLDFDSETP
jgi:hypothetical protein